MKRRIQETDCYRVALESLEQTFEVFLLIWKNLSKCCFSLLSCCGADHLTECIDTSLTEEHMLCTAKTDTFCTKLYSFLSICRSICVCTNFHCSVLVSPCHDASELTSDCSVYSRDDSVVPSMEMKSPSWNSLPASVNFLFSSSIAISPHPDTQHSPIPRATTAA